MVGDFKVLEHVEHKHHRKDIVMKKQFKLFLSILLVFLLVGCNNPNNVANNEDNSEEKVDTKYDKENAKIFDDVPISNDGKQVVNSMGLNIFTFDYDIKYIDGIIEEGSNKKTLIFYLKSTPKNIKEDFYKAITYFSSISEDHIIYDKNNKKLDYENLSDNIKNISFAINIFNNKYKIDIEYKKGTYEDKEYNTYQYTFDY